MKPQQTPLGSRIAREFRCLGPSCPDTCCAGWTIEIDDATRQKYESKADLAAAFGPCGDGSDAMLCTSPTGLCQQNRDGWCSVQERYGEDFLSDTCFFYPRTYRRLGGLDVVGVSLSCPETARMALFGAAMFERAPYPHRRRMNTLPDRLPAGMDTETALAVNDRLLTALQSTKLSAEALLRRLTRMCYALEEQELSAWPASAAFYMRAEPPSASLPIADSDYMHILHGFFNIAVTDGTQYRPRLYRTLRDMEQAMDTPLHWKEATLDYSDASWQAISALRQHSRQQQEWLAPLLHKWLCAYVASNVFPFGGLGTTPREQIFALVTRFATVRLALMCCSKLTGGKPPPEDVIRVVQSIARLNDHITDFDVLRAGFNQPAWQTEKGLLSLIGDTASFNQP